MGEMMPGLVIGGLALLYICVFFPEKQPHKIAALFAVDSAVLAYLFASGAENEKISVFIIAAAAVNITAYFIPQTGEKKALGPLDFAAFAVIGVITALAAWFIWKNPWQPAGVVAVFSPAVIVFLFMVFSVSGYFIARAWERGAK